MTLDNIYTHFEKTFDFFGFEEWKDAFNTENIGSTALQKAYHLNVPSILGGPINHTEQETYSTVTATFFAKGYRYPKDAKLEAVKLVEKIIRKACNIKDRTTGLLNVVFEDAAFDFIASSNDNIVKVEMRFTAEVILDVEEDCLEENCLNC